MEKVHQLSASSPEAANAVTVRNANDAAYAVLSPPWIALFFHPQLYSVMRNGVESACAFASRMPLVKQSRSNGLLLQESVGYLYDKVGMKHHRKIVRSAAN